MRTAAVFCLMCLMTLSLTASADADDRCGHYSRRARIQQDENQRLGCGYSGPRWTGDHRSHYEWCKKVPQSQADRETAERERMLSQCRQRKNAGDNRCRGYANQAVSQQRQNMARGCGYTGPEWRDDYQTHFDWCRRTDWGQVQAQTSRRDQALMRCQAGGRCQDYARRAVEQYNRSRRQGCNYSGPEWRGDYYEHLKWCQSSPWNKVQEQDRRREDALSRCNRQSGDCYGYARRASDMVQEARRLGCGFYGPRWQWDYYEHLKWCQGAPWDKVREEDRARQEELERCQRRRGGGTYGAPYGGGYGQQGYGQGQGGAYGPGGQPLGVRDCQAYANQSEQQSRRNVKNACGYTGTEWIMGRQWHLQWCNQVPWAQAMQALQRRESQLQRCGTR